MYYSVLLHTIEASQGSYFLVASTTVHQNVILFKTTTLFQNLFTAMTFQLRDRLVATESDKQNNRWNPFYFLMPLSLPIKLPMRFSRPFDSGLRLEKPACHSLTRPFLLSGAHAAKYTNVVEKTSCSFRFFRFHCAHLLTFNWLILPALVWLVMLPVHNPLVLALVNRVDSLSLWISISLFLCLPSSIPPQFNIHNMRLLPCQKILSN